MQTELGEKSSIISHTSYFSPQMQAPQSMSVNPILPRLEQIRVLLVEDSEDNQRLFHRILTSAGADVKIACNGAFAIEIFDSPEVRFEIASGKLPFDVIVMDIRMPIVDGYQATREIRKRGFSGPIVALTAHATPGEEERCMQSGCSAFQLKPIDRMGLLSAVSRVTKV